MVVVSSVVTGKKGPVIEEKVILQPSWEFYIYNKDIRRRTMSYASFIGRINKKNMFALGGAHLSLVASINDAIYETKVFYSVE